MNPPAIRTDPFVFSNWFSEILRHNTAKDRLVTYPHATASQFKRLMGTSERLALNGNSYSPEELSALVLKQIKADAEAFLGEHVEEAIISVLAYFNNNQRTATLTAARLAGLHVERLINEPTAAALALTTFNGPVGFALTNSRLMVFPRWESFVPNAAP